MRTPGGRPIIGATSVLRAHPMPSTPSPAAPAAPRRPVGWLAGLLLGLQLAWLAPGAVAGAPPRVQLTADTTHLPLTDRLEYLADTGHRWSLQTPPPADAGWRPLAAHAGGGNFGHVKHAVWFRLTIDSALDRPTDWRWVVDHPLLTSIELAVSGADGQPPRVQVAGVAAMARGDAPRQRAAALPLQAPARGSVQVLMRVGSEGVLRVPVHLYSEAAWADHDRWLHTVLGAYFGLIAGLLAYNGVLWLRLRDASYGHYVGFGLGIAVYQLGSTGLGAVHAWPGAMAHSTLIMAVASAWFAAFGLLFTDQFLRLRDTAPRLSRWLRASALACLATLLLLTFLPAGDFIRWVLLPLAVWGVGLVVVAGVLGCWRRVPAAPIFLLGWSGLMVAGLMRAVMAQGWVSADSLPYHALLIATAAEMVLLSFALADRIRLERRARTAAEINGAAEQAARQVAQEALDERTRFVAAVMHDLQQPLYALSLATQSLERHPAAASLEAPLAQMNSAIGSAGRLLSSMTMMVRLDRASVTPDIVAFSMQDLIERLDALFAPLARQRGLQWRANPTLARVQSDPDLLERMLSNLIANAIRYTEQGGVLVTCRSRRAGLLVQVWDTGPGIDGDDLDGLFEEHVRGPGAQPGDRGLGLGLSIVRRCAHLLGVRLSVRSVPGRGSSFGCLIPWAREPVDPSPAP